MFATGPTHGRPGIHLPTPTAGTDQQPAQAQQRQRRRLGDRRDDQAADNRSAVTTGNGTFVDAERECSSSYNDVTCNQIILVSG